MSKILLTKRAEKDLQALPTPIAKRISAAIEDLATSGIQSSNIKKLKTPFPGYRKRIGDYRLLFEVNEEVILIYRISKRSEAYK